MHFKWKIKSNFVLLHAIICNFFVTWIPLFSFCYKSYEKLHSTYLLFFFNTALFTVPECSRHRREKNEILRNFTLFILSSTGTFHTFTISIHNSFQKFQKTCRSIFDCEFCFNFFVSCHFWDKNKKQIVIMGKQRRRIHERKGFNWLDYSTVYLRDADALKLDEGRKISCASKRSFRDTL